LQTGIGLSKELLVILLKSIYVGIINAITFNIHQCRFGLSCVYKGAEYHIYYLQSMVYIIVSICLLVADGFILHHWSKRKKQQGKNIAWYWGFLSPSLVIAIPFVLLVGVLLQSVLAADTLGFREKNTKSEMDVIRQAVLHHQQETGTYPASLESLIGNNPLRQEWRVDFWQRPYIFQQEGPNTFWLISSGKDKVAGTEDDIRIKLNKSPTP
jgi:hypothetical protein